MITTQQNQTQTGWQPELNIFVRGHLSKIQSVLPPEEYQEYSVDSTEEHTSVISANDILNDDDGQTHYNMFEID